VRMKKWRKLEKRVDNSIMGLIDNMISLLGKEGNDDKIKKNMCEVDFTRNGDKKAQLENGIKANSAEVANLKDNLALVIKEMQKIRQDLADLDKTVKEATEQRKEENAAFSQMLSETNQAVGILEVAKNRLKEFYGAAFVQQQSGRQAVSFIQEGSAESSSDEFGFSASGEGFLSAYEDASQEKARHKRKPQGQGAKAVLKMVATIQEDLTREFQAAKKEEKEDQADYESMLADAKKKREESARAITAKEGSKAALQAEKKKKTDRIAGLKEEHKETEDVIADLHEDCDWLLKNFEERKKLRAAEVEALTKAKATLAGADY